MNAFQKRITLRVLGVHATVIFLVAVVPLMRGCFKPKPKEIVTFVVVDNSGPPVNVQQVSHMPDPEPPAPEPEPERIPEPVKEKPVPIKKKPEPIKKKPEPVKKPKQRLARPEDIKIGPKVKSTPKKPTVSERDIKSALAGITSPAKSSGDPNRFSHYYSQVMAKLHAAWVPPSTVGSISRPAEVRFSMRSNGAITARKLTTSSGNSVFDQTVMKAANRVGVLPKPPADYNFDYVIVPFAMPE
ncbi:MAG: TonB C-terminal domain-containing protein [Verrucomicrobia bacterium]|nr:TonB C-terminal domain-containing protein [Verrucomicrobiota bacterium]